MSLRDCFFFLLFFKESGIVVLYHFIIMLIDLGMFYKSKMIHIPIVIWISEKRHMIFSIYWFWHLVPSAMQWVTQSFNNCIIGHSFVLIDIFYFKSRSSSCFQSTFLVLEPLWRYNWFDDFFINFTALE